MFWIAAFLLGVALLVLLGRVLFRPDNSKSAQLMRRYKHMTPALLAETPDDELATAVASNLLAKAEALHMDAYAVIPSLGEERCTAYSVWLFLRELEKGEPESLRQSGQFGFSELAADGLDSMEQGDLASLLRDYLQTADNALVDTMKQTVVDKHTCAALVSYIRDHASAFCDE